MFPRIITIAQRISLKVLTRIAWSSFDGSLRMYPRTPPEPAYGHPKITQEILQRINS